MDEHVSRKKLILGIGGVIIIAALIFGGIFYYQETYVLHKPQTLPLVSPLTLRGSSKNPHSLLNVTQGTIIAINPKGADITIEKPVFSADALKSWPEHLRKNLPTKPIPVSVSIGTETRIVSWVLYDPPIVNQLLANYFLNKEKSADTQFPKIYSVETPLSRTDLNIGDKVFIVSTDSTSTETTLSADTIAKQIPKTTK